MPHSSTHAPGTVNTLDAGADNVVALADVTMGDDPGTVQVHEYDNSRDGQQPAWTQGPYGAVLTSSSFLSNDTIGGGAVGG